jgi:alpha-D-xyloside xylohydrolase
MKFTDGYWMVRDGFTLDRPAEAYDVWSRDTSAGGTALGILAPTGRIRSRGDTLNRSAATITVSSPLPGVLRVRIDRHTGGPDGRPAFELPGAGLPPVSIDAQAPVASFESGGLSARVSREPLRIDFDHDGRRLTSCLPRSIGLARGPDGAPFVFQQLSLGVGELVYGLGERFGPVVKNGQSIDIWNADGGTSSEQAYKNVPFFWTTNGYGIFVNHPERVSFEIGSEAVSRSQFSVPGDHLEYFVIAGPSPQEILGRYTELTGRPPRIPRWSFGLWLSTSFTTDYDEPTVTHFIDGMAQRNLPLSVFHFDCFWMREFRWCDFEWDPRTFPEPEAMLARIKDRGLRVCVWINPYIAQLSPLFEEGRAHGYLVRRPDGSVWQWDKWQAGMALVDFTNPAAAEWFSAKLERLLDQGVDAFKTDFGERIPTDVVWHDGSDPERMHNYYTQMYNRTVFELLRRRRGEGEAVVFARSATTGGQQFPVHWGGDCESSFEAMAETLRGGLSLAASGFAYWSHDIGGFEGTPDAGVFKRWLAFGLLSSHSRLHGSNSYRVPWAFDDEAVDVARRFTELKMTLMPYLARLADDATASGAPLLRPMVYEFPNDPAVPYLDTQYMLGDALLVAPVFQPTGPVRFYVPEGRWTSLLDSSVVTGPGWQQQDHAYDSLPVLVRPGTVLPRGARRDRPDYHYADDIALHVYGVEALRHSRVRIPGTDDIDDSVFDVEFSDGMLTVSRTSGPEVSWSVVLPAGSRPASATGGRLESTSDGGHRIATSEASISVELLA